MRDHLFDRLRERKITAEDLYQLKLWRETEPDAPEGLWYKDFGSFKICGEGKFPKTFLLAGQPARGARQGFGRRWPTGRGLPSPDHERLGRDAVRLELRVVHHAPPLGQEESP